MAAERTTRLDSVAEVRRDPVSGVVIFAQGEGLSDSLATDPEYRRQMADRQFEELALFFLDNYKYDFLIENPLAEFETTTSSVDSLGYHQVRLQQKFDGLKVVGAELMIQFTPGAKLISVQGRYVPTPKVDRDNPRYSAQDALRIAKEVVDSDFKITDPELVIYPIQDGGSVLAFQLTASRGLGDGWRMVIDANDGSVLSKVPTRYP